MLYLITNENMTQSILIEDPNGAEMALEGRQRSGDALAHEFAGMFSDCTTHLYTVDPDALKAILQPVATHTEAMKADAEDEFGEEGVEFGP